MASIISLPKAVLYVEIGVGFYLGMTVKFYPQAQLSQLVPFRSPRSQPPWAAGHSAFQAELLFQILSRAGSENLCGAYMSYEFTIQELQQKSCSIPNECQFILAAPFYRGCQCLLCSFNYFQSAVMPYENRHAGSQDSSMGLAPLEQLFLCRSKH